MAVIQNQKSYLAFSRFGLGYSDQISQTDLAALTKDPKGAILAEIEAGISPMPSDLPNTQQAAALFYDFQKNKAEANLKDPVASKMMKDSSVLMFRAALHSFHGLKFHARIGFVERWLMFWDNHFAVSSDKNTLVRSIIGAYHNETIRTHGFSNFKDLLISVERHPAMLMYLDNARSVGPLSPAGLRSKSGLNENLAREILELHTLGVKGGYSQKDVLELAKIITGWAFRSKNDIDKFNLPFDYVFFPQRHEPKEKTLLGIRYEEGENGGLMALNHLANHKNTAQFIAKKLAIHFVADNPPPSLVKKLADNFIKTKGNLKELAKTLVTSEEAWGGELQKIRRPQEWLLASYRAIHHLPEITISINHSNLLGQPAWRPTSPKGYSDNNADWLPNLNIRIEIAQILARAIKGENSPLPFAEKMLGANMSPITRQAISRAESFQQGVVLALLSPEFLRR